MDQVIQECIDSLKEIQDFIIDYVDSDDQEYELDTFDKLTTIIDSQNLKFFLHLISKISNNHHRSNQFFNKIEQILLLLKTKITSNYSNFTIFNIFKRNKRVLLILLQNDIIKFDNSILNYIKNGKKIYQSYTKYFLPENNKEETSEEFEQKRQEGENDNYICFLIRNDLVNEFIVYYNKKNFCLASKVPGSIFETNVFLLKKDPTLLEYAAFFGSIQIFQYLVNNKVYPDFNLWHFAVHSNNPEFIHILERLDIGLTQGTYKKYFLKSIKCFHNDIANYFTSVFVLNEYKELEPYFFKYYNFHYIMKEMINTESFKYLCQYDYLYFVDILLQWSENDTKFETIFNLTFFMKFIINN